MTTYTRSGTRRAGDEYQDIIALDVLVSMLEHPDRFDWVRVEADDFGYLDDVVVLRKDGVIEAKQVKFSAHPEKDNDPYDWNILTAIRKGKDGSILPSLICKWGLTLLDLLTRYGKVEAMLVSNRRAAPDISCCVEEGTNRIQPERISPENMQVLSQQLGDKDSVIRVLNSMEFRLDCPELMILEEGVFRRFKSLGGTYTGWLNLKDSLGKWVGKKDQPGPEGYIYLANVQQASLWNQLEALPQNFTIPSDYVLPSGPLHKTVLNRLSEKTGTCLVINGTPGIGKSTYLSYLHDMLQEKKCPVVRHHYFLSLGDTTVGRFEHDKVIKSLMADLRVVAMAALGALDAQNPEPSKFPQWLDACSGYYSRQEYPLVIIVDGLDHAWRERRDTAELTRLFEYLLPCRPGICLVVGTQPLAADCFPKRLLDAAPRSSWISLPALDRQAVLDWTRNNEARLAFTRDLRSGDREEEVREIASAFYDVSKGQPLLLRYGLNALIQAGHPVNAHSIRDNITVNAGNIDEYYRSLWNGLNEDGRFLLCIIAAANYEWPQGSVVDCCVRHEISRLDAERSWQQIVHMMSRQRLGWIFFHSSLRVFVTGTTEYGALLKQVQPVIASWMIEEAPAYWRWAYEWPLQAELGDNEPLLKGTTREWVVESLAKGYPHAQVCALLRQAARQSLVSGDFHGFAHKSLLYDYVSNRFNLSVWESNDEWIQAQLSFNFVDSLPDILICRQTELTDRQLAALGAVLRTKGDSDGVDNIYVELLDRNKTRGRAERSHDWISEVMPIIWTESLVKDFDPGKISERIRRNRNHINSIRFSCVHAEAFRAHRRADLLRELCGADLTEEERRQFLKQGFLLALEEGADWSDVAQSHCKDIYANIYARVAGLKSFVATDLSLPNCDILSKPERGPYDQNGDVAGWLIYCYESMLSHYLWGRDEPVQKWLSEVGEHTWPRAFVQRLSISAKELATAILSKRKYSIGDMYKTCNGLEPPKFNNRSGDYEFWLAARRALNYLGHDNMVLASFPSAPCYERDAMETVFDSPHCYWNDWIREYVGRMRLWLSEGALERIADKFGNISSISIKELADDGVQDATVLANLMAMHGKKKQTLTFLLRAVSLTIRYGGHKDILLHDYVDTIGKISGRFPEIGRREISPVISAILHVGEYTDGKETRHVPARLFDLLTTLSPGWLPPIYQHLCRAEAYYDAADAFCRLLRSLPFASPVEIAVGSTSLDKAELDELAAKASEGCAGAQQALESVRQLISTNPVAIEEKAESVPPADSELPKGSVEPKIADYPPVKLQEYWRAVREFSYGRGAEELKAWANYWEQHASLSVVRDALISLHDMEDYAEVANLIHDITVRLHGRSDAWPWLVMSFQEINGWSAYWAGKEPAQTKWEIVRRHYPERWLDFVVETMEPGRWIWSGIGIHGRFPRLIEYLLMFGKEAEAWAVLQGVREVIEGLVAPLGVKEIARLGDINLQEDQILGVLLARLTWPSGMVRERACNALAELLRSGKDAELVSSALVEWIGEQSLEDVVCLGVLPFIKARQLTPEILVPKAEMLRSICTRPSLLYEILLEDLELHSWQSLPAGVGYAGTAPTDFHPSKKFIASGRVLPQIYQSMSSAIEARFGVAFNRQWAYEVEQTGDGLGRAHTSVDFWGRSDGKHYVAFDSPMSEGLRSGFLRALAWVADQGEDQRLWAMGDALHTLPIDLGLWEVSPQLRPEWWPQCNAQGSKDIDTVPALVYEAVGKLWERQQRDEWVIGMASGRVAEGGTIYDLNLFGLFQKCLGTGKPGAKAVWESEPWWKTQIMLQPMSARFGGTPICLSKDNGPLRIGDWMITPSVLAGRPHMASRWQWWRLVRGIWLPFPALARDSNYQVNCQKDRIVFIDEDGELGFWKDWTFGLSEMQDADLLPRTGHILMLRRSSVERYAAANGMTYCLACRIEGFHRKYDFGEYERFSIHQIIGDSSLIL